MTWEIRRQYHNDTRSPPTMEGLKDQRLWLGWGIYPTATSSVIMLPPIDKAITSWSVEPPDGVLQGTIYTDGSAYDADIRSACRAGWGLAMIQEPGSSQVTGAAYGPLPTFAQSARGAEVFAAALAIRMACPLWSW